MNKVINIVKYVLLVVMFFVLTIVVVQRVTNNKVKIFGYSMYNIISESMKPQYEIGDVVVAKTVKEEELRVGDNIVYKGEKADFKDKIVTHKLVRIQRGSPRKYTTRGISNLVDDPEITFNQIQGRVIGKSVILSFFSKIANDNVLFYAIIFIPFTILVFADINDVIKEKNEKKKQRETEAVEKKEE